MNVNIFVKKKEEKNEKFKNNCYFLYHKSGSCVREERLCRFALLAHFVSRERRLKERLLGESNV